MQSQAPTAASSLVDGRLLGCEAELVGCISLPHFLGSLRDGGSHIPAVLYGGCLISYLARHGSLMTVLMVAEVQYVLQLLSTPPSQGESHVNKTRRGPGLALRPRLVLK